MHQEIGDDLLDLRDLWKRFTELNDELTAEIEDDPDFDADNWEDFDELKVLKELFAEVGEPFSGGEFDEPTLIRDSYFEDYARQYAEDVGAIEDDARWPATCIDWAEAAKELQMDYTSYEIDGHTYWRG